MGTLATELFDVLPRFEINGMVVTPPRLEIDKGLYAKAKKVLTDLGGQWGRGQFTFPYEPQHVITQILRSGILPEKNPLAFFPTPDPVVDFMFLLADSDLAGLLQARSEAIDKDPSIRPYRLLEPSCGTGHIAKRLRTIMGQHNLLDTVEINPINQGLLKEDGFDPFCGDFLDYNTDYAIEYDFIFMNPPFSVKGHPQAYIEHFFHAYHMLRPGGLIVIVTPTGFLTNNSTALEAQFLSSLCENDSSYCEYNDDKAFKSSGTAIDTCIISISRPYHSNNPVTQVDIAVERFELFTFHDSQRMTSLFKLVEGKQKHHELLTTQDIDRWCLDIIKQGLKSHPVPVFIDARYVSQYRALTCEYLLENNHISMYPANLDEHNQLAMGF